jgi:hypothetical protein
MRDDSECVPVTSMELTDGIALSVVSGFRRMTIRRYLPFLKFPAFFNTTAVEVHARLRLPV